MDRFNQDTLHFILENAILAPSADNQHRIRFQLVDDTIRVRYTEAELPPQGGYRRVLALLSLGWEFSFGIADTDGIFDKLEANSMLVVR